MIFTGELGNMVAAPGLYVYYTTKPQGATDFIPIDLGI